MPSLGHFDAVKQGEMALSLSDGSDKTGVDCQKFVVRITRYDQVRKKYPPLEKLQARRSSYI